MPLPIVDNSTVTVKEEPLSCADAVTPLFPPSDSSSHPSPPPHSQPQKPNQQQQPKSTTHRTPPTSLRAPGHTTATALTPTPASTTPTQAPRGGLQPAAAAANNAHTNPSASKTAPRNSEYLQRQSKNADLRGGPSPAQASDAPADMQAPTQQQLTQTTAKSAPPSEAAVVVPTGNNSTAALSHKAVAALVRMPKVSLARLSVEHVNIMEHSLTEFAKKAPDLAQKLGVMEVEVDTSMRDMFTMMKADERKGLKRNNPTTMLDEDEIGKCKEWS